MIHVQNAPTAPPGAAQWPRPVREIRDELVTLAGTPTACRPVDPARLDTLADELAWAAAIALMYGGNSAATQQLERAVRRPPNSPG